MANSQQPNLANIRYFDTIQEALQLTPEELTRLHENRFVITDRLAFDRFKRAYAWIYWKDLPVLITTDSILHVIHYGYDRMVKWLEGGPIRSGLGTLLTETHEALHEFAAAHAADEPLRTVCEDLDFYLTVISGLGKSRHRFSISNDEDKVDLPPEIDALVTLIQSTSAKEKESRESSREWHRYRQLEAKGKTPHDSVSDDEIPPEPVFGIETITALGVERRVDISQFTPRGHYVEEHPWMEYYFWTMMWLALIDFPLTKVNPDGSQSVQIRPLAAAHLLRDCIDAAGQREMWEKLDEMLRQLVGWSDNITLDGLDSLIEDLGTQSPADYFTADPDWLTAQLLARDYGQSKITGRVLNALDAQHESPAPLPLSFALMGQRFTLESWIMQELVYDRLMVDGERVPRAYPNSLDVMATLGNGRAKDHLDEELTRYRYEARLDELTDQVCSTSYEFWENSFYNRWLNIIRTLNAPVPACPPVMHSAAWMDKTLHTQLASWTQLRHDNILFVKQPIKLYAVCEYPAGYVEPYPDFYAAVEEYAHAAEQMLSSLQEHPLHQPKYFLVREDIDDLIQHYARLGDVAHQLCLLAEKELRHEPFTEAETLFLRSVVVRKYVGDPGYGGRVEEEWHGWYSDLVDYDVTPALIADLYTNPDPRMGPVGVLHTATGRPVVEVMIVGDGEQSTAYIGPSFTYLELLQSDGGLRRLDDQDWQTLCDPKSYLDPDSQGITLPHAPEWVTSFRVLSEDVQHLKLPARQELSPEERIKNDAAAPPSKWE